MSARTARRAAGCQARVARRGTQPSALREEARSVRLRVEGVLDATHLGETIAIEDIDAITTTLVDLQWRIERSRPERHGDGGIDALLGARRDIGASVETVSELVEYFATV
ncbi:hypothetical protein [Patulibacter minatonensis]|uniref:hypothetical protein n=1 Tax=Patulibacter minatonensis TaxID=298163 RepID=UPI00047DBCCF|nr:hypothetical protein [Patulibacter minatonensis]